MKAIHKAIQTALLQLGLLLLLNGGANAQATKADAPATSASTPETPASDADTSAGKFDLTTRITKGDRIKLRSTLNALTPLNGSKGTRALVDTCMRITTVASDKTTVAVEDGQGLLGGFCLAVPQADATGTATEAVVRVGDTFEISAARLSQTSYSRYGWINGPMVVPFKYFPHDRSFEPSQTLGMYLGYRTSWFESRGLSWVVSAGLATMKASQVVDDTSNPGNKTTKESTVAGYTLAAGMLFDLTADAKPFVAGLLIGRDFVGRNSALTYKHDNRTWIALQVGWTL